MFTLGTQRKGLITEKRKTLQLIPKIRGWHFQTSQNIHAVKMTSAVNRIAKCGNGQMLKSEYLALHIYDHKVNSAP